MTDYQQLFSCAKLEPMPDFAFENEQVIEVAECDFCIERATRSVEFKQNGIKRHVFTCDECHLTEDWTGKEIILITKI